MAQRTQDERISNELELIESTTDHVIAVWRGVVIYAWRGVTTNRAATLLQRTMEQGRESKVPTVLLGVIEQGAPPPSGEVRQTIADALRGGNDYVRASAVVFAGVGFQASMVRAVVTGLALLSRPKFPHQVFADASAATSWLTRDATPGSYRASELEDVLSAVRATPPSA